MESRRPLLSPLGLALLAAACPSAPQERSDLPGAVTSVATAAVVQPELLASIRRTDGWEHGRLAFADWPTPELFRELHGNGIVLHDVLGEAVYTASFRRDAADYLAAQEKDHLLEARFLVAEERVGDDLDLHRDAGPPDRRVELVVGFFPEVDAAAVQEALAPLGGQPSRFGADNSWRVRTTLGAIQAIEEDPRVLYVREHVPLERANHVPPNRANDDARPRVESDAAQGLTLSGPSIAFTGRSGAGVDLAVCDDGFDEDHPDLEVDLDGDAKIFRRRNADESPFTDGDLHSTRVASIAAGTGAASEDFGRPPLSLRGHAPNARIGNYLAVGADAELRLEMFATDGADLLVEPYGQSSNAAYDPYSRSIDQIIAGDGSWAGTPVPARPEVRPAGNAGWVDPDGDSPLPAAGYYAVVNPSKNSICVGATNSRHDLLLGIVDRVTWFSSMGPTRDGRIKPDVVAPGAYWARGSEQEGTTCAKPVDDTDTVPYSVETKPGTSFSCPVVAGVVALMMEAELATFLSPAPCLHPATYRAILVHTANDVAKLSSWPHPFDLPSCDSGESLVYPEGPDFTTGWGVVDAESAVDVTAEPELWNQATLAKTGDVHTWTILRGPGDPPPRVTIAWDDPAGVVDDVAAPMVQLVSDLDVRLVDPVGGVHRPWTLPAPTQGSSTPGAPAWKDDVKTIEVSGGAAPGENRRDNVERVDVPLFPAPASGAWEVRVEAWLMKKPVTQRYTIVSNLPLRPTLGGERFRPVAPVDVQLCDLFPELCVPSFDEPVPACGFDGVRWSISESCLVDVEDLAIAAGTTLHRNGLWWERQPGFRIQVRGLPDRALAVLVDDRGQVHDSTEPGDPGAVLRLPFVRPGLRYYVGLVDASRTRFEGSAVLRLVFERD